MLTCTLFAYCCLHHADIFFETRLGGKYATADMCSPVDAFKCTSISCWGAMLHLPPSLADVSAAL